MKNRWKVAFFTLLSIMLMGVSVMSYILFKPIEASSPEKKEIHSSQTNPLELTANKENLTEVIQQYINEQQQNGSVEYFVDLTDHIELFGKMAFFPSSIDFQMTFEPKVLENGDITLIQKTMSLGGMNLPVSTVLNVISRTYDMPEWIHIKPNDESIYLALTEMNLQSGLNVQAKTFDLENDDISFFINP
ncbi:YpmS family protein [Bacillus spongiae]|uniref:YpmS family protein n=1 Tax=Bacillus spongiae TaxID=2683610 RepID=A0ABU8HH08_9BACI